MSKQYSLTILTPIKEGSEENLRTELNRLKTILIDSSDIDYDKESDEKDQLESTKYLFHKYQDIHYARWIIVKSEVIEGVTYGTKLALFANTDKEPTELMEYMAEKYMSVLSCIYNNCEGFSEIDVNDKPAIAKYFERHTVSDAAFYTGAPGKTAVMIKNEDALRKEIQNWIENNVQPGQSAKEIHQQIKTHVLAKFDWLDNSVAPMPKVKWVPLILFGALLLALSPFIIFWAIYMQVRYERKDKPLGKLRYQLDHDKMKKLETYEDLEFQNQFSQLMTLKPGKARLYTFKALMLFAKVLIKLKFVKGKLMGIPTIHFARWVLFDDNKRVLFASNFDGSWQQYLGDFIDKSGWGLTGIFCNTTQFPKSKFLFFGGAYDEERFLAWSRYFEIETQVWYNAYPNLSIKNVINNGHIREELMQNLNEKQAQSFLNRF
jgi:hypothetical protein